MTGSLVRALAVLVLVATTDASAQTNTGELRGIVRDQAGAVVPGAAVTAVHDADGAVLERITDDEGRFFFPALRPGQWDVTVAAAGFASAVRRGVVLELGRILHGGRRSPEPPRAESDEAETSWTYGRFVVLARVMRRGRRP